MTTEPLCYLNIGCGQCGIVLNPWHVYNRQIEAYDPTNLQLPAAGLDPKSIHGLCDDFAPAEDSPVPWDDPSCPTVSGDGFGFIFRSFTLGSPREIGRNSSKTRAKQCVQKHGRREVTIRVEAVGRTKQAAQHVANWLIDRTCKAKACCGQTAEIFQHCCTTDGKSGRRMLTDVGELFAECSTDEGATPCGVIVDLTFSAGSIIVEPDGRLEGVEVFSDAVCMPTCPPTTQRITPDLELKKRRCVVDVTGLADGTTSVCKVNFDTFNHDDCYLVVRRTEIQEASDAECCPLQADVTLDEDGVFALEPRQPDLWAAEVDAALAAGEQLDCSCPPIATTFTLPNVKYDPTCEACPIELRASTCAEDATGLTISTSGVIDLAPFTGSYWWTGPGSVPAIQPLLDYFECISLRIENSGGETFPGWDPEIAVAWCQSNFPTNGVVGADIWINTFGHDFSIRPNNAPNTTSQADCNLDIVSGSGAIPGYPASPIQDFETAVGCLTELPPAVCLPTVTVVPSDGGPCVDLILDAAGQISHAERDGVTVDLLSWTSMEGVSFRFGPCTATATELCAPVLPDDAALDIDLATLTATGNNFTITAGWPFDTDASQYTVATVDGVDNVDGNYITEGSPITVPADSPVVCEPPCGPGFIRRAPDILDDQCWECLDDERNILVYKIDGLDPKVDYQPLLTVTGGADSLDQVQAFMSATPAGFMAPQDSLAGYVCGLTQLPPIEAFRIQPGEQLVVDGCDVSFKCAGRTFDGFADRYVNSGERPWVDPWICGDCAWLVLTYPCEHEPPTVVFAVEPVSQR